MSKTILVAEDEKTLLDVITKKLELNDFKVLQARTVKEAEDHVKNNQVDAIWLDHYLLGKESGLDFVTDLKSTPNQSKIPIFVVSNTASFDKVSSYLKLGIKRYFTKADYRLDEIIQDIRHSLEEGKNE